MKGGAFKFFLPIGLFAGLVGIFYVGLYQDPTIVPSPFIGKPAPEFELPTLYSPDKTFGTSDMRGRVALLNVWASWCPSCVQEHELLMQIAAEGRVPVYGLNWKDERSAAIKWLRRLGNPYSEIAHDYDNVVGIDWGVYGAPETFLVDANGIIIHKQIGELTPEIWERDFVPLIDAALKNSANEPAAEEGTG